MKYVVIIVVISAILYVAIVCRRDVYLVERFYKDGLDIMVRFEVNSRRVVQIEVVGDEQMIDSRVRIDANGMKNASDYISGVHPSSKWSEISRVSGSLVITKEHDNRICLTYWAAVGGSSSVEKAYAVEAIEIDGVRYALPLELKGGILGATRKEPCCRGESKP